MNRTAALALLGLCLCVLLLGGGTAHAAKLEIGADAPFWQHLGAGTLLYLHIGGGTIGLLAGVFAIASRKGRKVHRSAGKAFLAAMLVTYAIGAGVAPFLNEGQRPNFIGGVMALYLLISGWLTVKSPGVVRAGPVQYAGLAAALTIAAMGYLFFRMGANSPTGTVDGSPPQAFILFMTAGTIAALGEVNIIVRGSISGAARLARHLWRMCFSMFIASASLFLGQPQIFSDSFNNSPAPFLFAFAPLMAMLIWLVLVRLRRRKKAPSNTVP